MGLKIQWHIFYPMQHTLNEIFIAVHSNRTAQGKKLCHHFFFSDRLNCYLSLRSCKFRYTHTTQ